MPDVNPHVSRAVAVHYGTVVLPTRKQKPRDNAWPSFHAPIEEQTGMAQAFEELIRPWPT